MNADVLVVDDEADIRELVAGILSDEGYAVRTAADSDSALAALRARKPALLVLDIWMQGGGMDGLELLDLVKVRLYMTGVATKSAKGSGRRGKIRTLKLATIYPDRGIEVETFDDTIEIMNTIQGDILYGGDL